MLRVARVPEPEFERRVEAAKPATVTELAEIGTAKKADHEGPPPFRMEWLRWTHAVEDLATIPDCGLDVLAARRPDALDDLRAQCAAALTNLTSWQLVLEAYNVRSKANDGERDVDLFARADQRRAANV